MKTLLAIGYWLLAARRGQAALSFVFLVGTIILSIGVTVAFLAASFLNSGYGFQAANKATAIASAGAEDALMRLARNKDFSAGSPYTMPLGSDSASVTVAQDSPVSGQAKILSTATVSFQTRKIQVVVSVNDTTGQINLLSWQLVTL